MSLSQHASVGVQTAWMSSTPAGADWHRRRGTDPSEQGPREVVTGAMCCNFCGGGVVEDASDRTTARAAQKPFRLMQLRYAAWYVASFAPAAFIPWICGSDDSMTLLVKSMEFIVMAPTRAVSARTWSPMIGEAVPALTASGASSLQTAKSAAVGISPSAARVAASETRRIRARALTTLYCIAMSYSFQIIASAGAILADPRPLSFTIR